MGRCSLRETVKQKSKKSCSVATVASSGHITLELFLKSSVLH
jgi:hypothetical protein